MTGYRYYTATTLDGFLADDQDDLSWLLRQPIDADGPMNHGEFINGIGAIVMGATTYEWLLRHELGDGAPWPYQVPTYVFSHRDLTPATAAVHLVSGPPAEHRAAIESAAQGRDVWVVGGGDLAAAFAAVGMLDEIIVSIAPVTLGSGRRLLGGAYDLALTEFDRNGAFLCARYDVVGPLGTTDADSTLADSPASAVAE